MAAQMSHSIARSVFHLPKSDARGSGAQEVHVSPQSLPSRGCGTLSTGARTSQSWRLLWKKGASQWGPPILPLQPGYPEVLVFSPTPPIPVPGSLGCLHPVLVANEEGLFKGREGRYLILNRCLKPRILLLLIMKYS